ncbi:MAG TPA: hypothetical protein ENJ97_05860, partial [Planctomycetes bacterium]|nr:hypothetical protein [Planctomycetota bacterium]
MKRAILGAFSILSEGGLLLVLLAGGAWGQKIPQPGSVKKKALGGKVPPKLVLPSGPGKARSG